MNLLILDLNELELWLSAYEQSNSWTARCRSLYSKTVDFCRNNDEIPLQE
ncbi:hypothetical protein AVEN_196796-1, partial [Araneus ventricosus]